MTVLLQISDTHFGTEQPDVVEAVVALASRERPDLVVLSGDITQRARLSQFRAAKAFVDRLGAPVLAIAGNHDIALFNLWTRLFRPYADYARSFGTEMEPVHASDNLLVVGVNTTRQWRHKNGEVSRSQIDRVAKLLEKAGPLQLRIVVVHQPAAVLHDRDRADLLRGHAAASRVWAAAGADVVMGGHIHLPYTLELQGLQRRLWVVQAGTAVSSRTRKEAPNSVNVLRWNPSDCRTARGAVGPSDGAMTSTVERWDFARADQAFVPVAAVDIVPDRP